MGCQHCPAKLCFPKSIHSLISKRKFHTVSSQISKISLPFSLLDDNLIFYFIENPEREISHLPTSNLTLSTHTFLFLIAKVFNLSPMHCSPRLEASPSTRELHLRRGFPLTFLKNFVLQITARTHSISKTQRSSWPSKERKRSRMRLKKEALGDWGKGEKHSLEICLGSSWFVYLCYHLLCNFCFRSKYSFCINFWLPLM